MCGIAGIFNYRTGEPIDRGELRRIREAMRSRGPDDAGDWFSADARIGLAHRRLSIIDLSPTGAQPMRNEEGTVVLTFNGEIYNYRELRSELEARGRRFQGGSDTEVLVHLYEAEGEAMVTRLRGMYAFILWDARKRGVFLARDPLGIKPLYYSDDGRTLRAASQVKALLAGGHIDTAPEPAGRAGFFLWGHVPCPYTLYRGIKGLPAGATLWVDEAGEKRERTFCGITGILADAEKLANNPPQPTSMGAEGRRLRPALLDSVRHHLIADVPVGVFLSSGVDSTTLAALTAELGGTLRTVTLGFEEFKGAANDETELAATVARQLGAAHQTVWVTRQDFREHRGRLFAAMDQPTTDGVNTYFVSLAAARASLKVALSGLGGDELFGGYPSFGEIPPAVRSLRIFDSSLMRPLARAFRVVSAPMLKHFTSPKYAGLFEYGGSYGGAYLLRRGLFMPWELPGLMDADMARAGWDELQPLLRLEESIAGLTNPRLKVSCLESCWYMRNQLLRDSDWAGMAHSLEIRVPLADLKLLRDLAPLLAGATPPTKRDLAQTPIARLPASILSRPKTGFSIPVREWLATVPDDRATAGRGSERGLRGWARVVYGEFQGEGGESKAGEGGRRSIVRPKIVRGSVDPQGRSGSKSTQARPGAEARRILVFRIGQLGDTIVALPAMWLVKEQFPGAYIALLCDRHPGKQYVLSSDLLRGTGLFDEFLSYRVAGGDVFKPWRMASLLARIRRKRFDTVVYLAPSKRSLRQLARDRRFFSLTGIRDFIGMEGFNRLPTRVDGAPFAESRAESDLLLDRLGASGLQFSPTDRTRMDLLLGREEELEVETWRQGLELDGGRTWVAVGPGSKMPAKRWPLERYAEVVQRLVEKYDIWPVVFGGAEDRREGDVLLAQWGRGHNAAGRLSLRGSGAALKRCAFYVGNDTGTMHLAAAVGTRCVALFSSRDQAGRWYPAGRNHRVFRSRIDCEGCGLTECIERRNECLTRISADEVLAGSEATLGGSELEH